MHICPGTKPPPKVVIDTVVGGVAATDFHTRAEMQMCGPVSTTVDYLRMVGTAKAT